MIKRALTPQSPNRIRDLWHYDYKIQKNQKLRYLKIRFVRSLWTLFEIKVRKVSYCWCKYQWSQMQNRSNLRRFKSNRYISWACYVEMWKTGIIHSTWTCSNQIPEFFFGGLVIPFCLPTIVNNWIILYLCHAIKSIPN